MGMTGLMKTNGLVVKNVGGIKGDETLRAVRVG
jgi:hypothetical protein